MTTPTEAHREAARRALCEHCDAGLPRMHNGGVWLHLTTCEEHPCFAHTSYRFDHIAQAIADEGERVRAELAEDLKCWEKVALDNQKELSAITRSGLLDGYWGSAGEAILDLTRERDEARAALDAAVQAERERCVALVAEFQMPLNIREEYIVHNREILRRIRKGGAGE